MNDTGQEADRQIEHEVLRQLHSDRRVEAAKIAAQVREGVVTLRGTLDSWGASVAALKAARRARGVVSVVSQLAVAVPAAEVRSDAELTQAVRHALAWNVFVPASAIQFSVENGIITLRGYVDDASQRQEAELTLANLAGVRRVSNLIDVEPGDAVADEVGLAIKEALVRHIHSLARGLHIHVEQGLATVSGDIDCVAERDLIVSAAQAVPGVARVEDLLRIGSS